MNTNDEGEHRITAKRSVSRKVKDRQTGQEMEIQNEAPKLLDKNKEPLDANVGNTSEGQIQVKPYENRYGKFLELQAVMVTKLVEYSPDDDELQF